MDAGYVEFPYDVEEEFGTRGQVKVAVTFDGHPYRGSLATMGRDRHCLGVTKKVREAIGKNPGDIVQVVLRRDEEPRTVVVPDALQQWLDEHPDAEVFFNELAYTYRKEYVQWITGAKREETRARRLKKAFELLANREKHP